MRTSPAMSFPGIQRSTHQSPKCGQKIHLRKRKSLWWKVHWVKLRKKSKHMRLPGLMQPWNTDTLKICHDASMCAKLLAACVSNEKTKRLAKVTHLKEQNSIGASMVTKFAKSNCNHIPLACPTADQSLAEDRYGKHAPNNFEFKFRFFEIII